ncbi:MAG: tetratricopeptide repeat protein [Nitrospiraceae bacterium]|nr:tetratricopeptide repeat protein [Nitrospiraceae bacterium]
MKLASNIVVITLAAMSFAGQSAAKDIAYYYDVGDWRRVIEEYRAHPADYASPEAMGRVADAYYQTGDFDAASETAGRSELKGDADAAIVAALVKAARGGRDAAMQALGMLASGGADAGRVYTAMGIVQRPVSVKEALAYFEKAAAASPGDYRPWFQMGLIYEDEERFEEAGRAYGKAIELNPLFAQAVNNLGYSYKERRFYQYAVEQYRKAIELIPDNAGYYYNLGNALTYREKIDGAFQAYKKALELAPTFAKAHYNMARTYLRKDMVNEAIAEFRLYLKYGNRAVFDFVASEDSVDDEIEQLEIYLEQNPPVRPAARSMAR